MILNAKKIQVVVLVIVILIIGYFVWQEFFNKESRVTPSNTESFYIFKVGRTDLTAEQVANYRQEFEVDSQIVTATAEKFNFDALNNMAQIKNILHDYEGARDIWEYVSAQRPKNSLSFFNLGLLYASVLKNNELAEKNFLQALANAEGETGNEQYYYALADFYNYNMPEKKTELEKILLAALETEPYKESMGVITLLAKYYGNNNQKDLALKYWQRTLVLSPDNVDIKTEINNLKNK